MSQWADIFLGVIAAATLAIAIGQVGLLVAAGRAFRRMERLADTVEHELKPIFSQLNAIGRDASRAATLATAQVERADRLLGDIIVRVEQTLNTIQSAVGATAREGAAVMAGFQAALAALRDLRTRRARSRAEDEDALFI